MSRTNVDTNFPDRLNQTLQTKEKTVSSNEFNLLHYITSLYGNTLSARGLNLLDPIYTNMFYYNKMRSKPLTDMPYVSRTYAFFTRPELNFSFENINAIPFFKWLYDKPIGKMVMSMLTDPDYYINAPGFANSNTEYMKTVQGYLKSLSGLRSDDGASYMDTAGGNAATSGDNVGEDDAAALAAMQSLNLDSLTDDAAIDNLLKEGNLKSIGDFYANYSKKVDDINADMYAKVSKIRDNYVPDPKDTVVQAKYIMRSTHNSKYDNFNFTSPFIPLLMNTCTNVTGAKDLNLQVYEYEEDEFSTKQNVATGMDDIWAPGTLTVSHEDIAYGPVSLLYMLWVFYIHYTSRGYIMPTRNHITERILDYTCSIYIFVIGPDGRTIERFGKFTGCYPTSFPLAQQLEHNQDVDPTMLHKLQITFQYNTYEPMNPEILTDFNFVSETEWLYRIKNWEGMYNRSNTLVKTAFLDYASKKTLSTEQLQKLRVGGRSEAIWEPISNPGMSGRVPRALINGSPIGSEENDLSKSDLVSDIWGGFPAIVNSNQLIWVLPSWDDLSAKHDRGTVEGAPTLE